MIRVMSFSLICFFALLCSAVKPASAFSSLTLEDFLEGTGGACLVGGAFTGLTAAIAGPVTITALVGGTIVLPTIVTTSVPAFFGCGVSAFAAVNYYSIKWIYETLFVGSRYPLLYPLREDLSKPSTGH